MNSPKTRGAPKGTSRPTYTEEDKRKVLEFLAKNPGRGAKKEAEQKFGISYATINKWSGGSEPGKSRLLLPPRAARNEEGSEEESITLNGVVYVRAPTKDSGKTRERIEKAMAKVDAEIGHLRALIEEM